MASNSARVLSFSTPARSEAENCCASAAIYIKLFGDKAKAAAAARSEDDAN
jgi:hypothetical protein